MSLTGELTRALRRAGLRIERVSHEHRLIRGRIRRKDLPRLAALPAVRHVDPARPGHLRAGAVTTEGDALSRAPQARATGFDATGVVVGVISDGVDRLALSIAGGELPAGTGVPPFPTCDEGSGDEGTAKLEIVHDLAPGATLRFSEGLSDKLAFVDAIDCLRQAGAKVIVDDVGFLDEPFFEDGLVAEEVREAVEAGVSFHSAAGNTGAVHYAADFAGAEDDGGTYHAFAGGDLFDRMDVPAGGAVTCVLQWADPFGASANDYDLELWDLDADPPALVDVSLNVQDGTQNPFEAVGVLNSGTTARRVGVRIRRESGEDRLLKLVCPGAENLQYRTPEGSIFGHPAVVEVVTVGAVDVEDFGLNDVEPFSGRGPVDILFPVREERDKPDLVAFDGVATSICPPGGPCFDPFFGTSAAAPHSAAVAALLLSKNGCLTPAEVRERLMAGAVDLEPAGFDDVSGAGLLDAFAVLTAPFDCDDDNPCTRDTCAPDTGCQNTVLPDGSACPDGDLCNGDETCQASACTPGTPLVCNDGSACTTDVCNAAVGCIFADACDDGDPCTTDACDPKAGCLSAPAPDGTPCPDADACNGAEACAAGVCVPGAPLVCTPDDACSTSACSPRGGCQDVPLEGFAGLACLCGVPPSPPACAGAATPAKVARPFARACDLIARAQAAARPRQARNLLAQAARRLAKAAGRAHRAGNRGRLDAACANALDRFLTDARGRALRLSGSL